MLNKGGKMPQAGLRSSVRGPLRRGVFVVTSPAAMMLSRMIERRTGIGYCSIALQQRGGDKKIPAELGAARLIFLLPPPQLPDYHKQCQFVVLFYVGQHTPRRLSRMSLANNGWNIHAARAEDQISLTLFLVHQHLVRRTGTSMLCRLRRVPRPSLGTVIQIVHYCPQGSNPCLNTNGSIASLPGDFIRLVAAAVPLL